MNRRIMIVVAMVLTGFRYLGIGGDPLPPVAKKIPSYDTLHNDVRVDHYSWIRDRNNPDVVRLLESENSYTDAMMKPTEALQETLYQEMISRIKETDQDPPYRVGNFYYYNRTEKGKQYAIVCRKQGSLDSPEEIILDPNELSKGYSFYRIGTIEVSPDQNKLAYSVDTNGSESYTMMMKNLVTGSLYPDRVSHTSSVIWAMDNATLFYTVEDSAKRPYRVYRHVLGTEMSSDTLVYEETDALYTLWMMRSRSDRFIFLVSSASNSDEWRFIPADQPAASFLVITPRRPEFEYSVDHHGNDFYIRTNKEAATFRLMKTPVIATEENHWTELIPWRKGVTLEGMDFFADHMIIYSRVRGLQQIRITDLRSNATHDIQFPEPVYTAYGNVNKIWSTNIFRYSYQSMTTPATIYDYNLDTKQQEMIKQQEVLGGYDPSLYQSERIYANAEDGTEIPISIVYKKGVKFDGTAPLHLTGYGSYGASSQPTFSSIRISYLDRGMIYAIAHIRGGGDMGREWYDDGKLLKKKNTFTDFIACAEHLIKNRYTNKDRLTISGGSAGGLLMGAVVNMRPDLFRAVVASVPFVDVINTMLDEGLMYTAQEFLEWGNPKVPIYYDYMKTYCPYTNVRAQSYPSMLVKVGFNDPRVNYWEGTKWVQKMRELKTDTHSILLKVNMGAGHAGASGRYDRWREIAFDYAFVLSQSGLNTLQKIPDKVWEK